MSLDERKLDHCWEIIIKPALIDYFNQTIMSSFKVATNGTQPSQFNLKSIRWLDRDRQPADYEDQWSWAFVRDQQGNIPPEVKSLFHAVERYGEVHTEGFVITLGGNKSQLLNKRRAKDSSQWLHLK